MTLHAGISFVWRVVWVDRGREVGARTADPYVCRPFFKVGGSPPPIP